MFSILPLIGVTYISVIWTIPFILCKIFGINLYKVSAQETIPMILKNISKRSSLICEDEVRGFVWGFPYIGYVYEASSVNGSKPTIEIYLLTTEKYYKSITSKSNVENNDDSITVYYRSGNFFWLTYKSRSNNFPNYNPRDNQLEIISQIKNYYNSNNKAVCWIHGRPNSGKSTISILLAKEMKGSLCFTFNPTDPGDSIDLIYNAVCPMKENPLIIVFEECDKMIERIHYEKIERHKNIPIQVMDKTGFNTLFDWIDRGSYPNLIVLMTSNKSYNYIDEMDPSYLREGRVNMKFIL